MRRTAGWLALALASLPLMASQAPPPEAEKPQRTVAITIDDLPANSTQRNLATWRKITNQLVTVLARQSVPAIGFVNEGKLEVDGQVDPLRVKLLQRWLDAGLELGNHTYSHPSFFRTPLAEYQADVLKGEKITRPLMAKHGQELLWFRHPYLNTGPDLESKTAFEKFLAEHGYRVAPVSIDNSEWIYARAYDVALDRGDAALVDQVGDAYVAYMEKMFAYCEQQSVALLGYELRQILLLHANRLNGDRLPDLLEMMRQRGYRFISFSEAMEDPAYSREDRYTGRSGITWLHRWAITEGKDITGQEPEPEAFIHEVSGIGR